LHTPPPLINFKGQLGIHTPIKGFFLSFVPPKEMKRKKSSWLGCKSMASGQGSIIKSDSYL